MNTIEQFGRVVDTYCQLTGASRANVSKRIFGKASRIREILAREYDPGVSTLERAVQWFSDHWPEHRRWPGKIPRPTPRFTAFESAERGLEEV